MSQPARVNIDRSNWREFAAAVTSPGAWTAIVPAAGRGTRLGYELPKILFPIAGRPMLAWLLDLLAPHCERLVFVLSPEGSTPVETALHQLLPRRYDVVIQE